MKSKFICGWFHSAPSEFKVLVCDYSPEDSFTVDEVGWLPLDIGQFI